LDLRQEEIYYLQRKLKEVESDLEQCTKSYKESNNVIQEKNSTYVYIYIINKIRIIMIITTTRSIMDLEEKNISLLRKNELIMVEIEQMKQTSNEWEEKLNHMQCEKTIMQRDKDSTLSDNADLLNRFKFTTF
jgi:hypothetical protein